MPVAPSRACEVCGLPVTNGGWLCADHKNDVKASDRERWANDPIRHLYQTSQWRRFRPVFLGYNPRCQFLEHGEQCRAAATEIHHFISPRDNPALFVEPTNCAGLCKHHHHKAQGEPDTSRYVPTVWRLPGICGPQQEEPAIVALEEPLLVKPEGTGFIVSGLTHKEKAQVAEKESETVKPTMSAAELIARIKASQ